MTESGTLRLDKWLWFARFCKSRTLAAKVCASGRVRIGGEVINKAHHLVRPGDVLTFPLGPHIRVIRVLQLGMRRGPAAEARQLYEDLAPTKPLSGPAAPGAQREPGTGRPTKAERRAYNQLKGE